MRLKMAFQFHCANPEPLQAPDTTDELAHSGIDPNYVISRDKNGNVLSLFIHNSWDCRIYGAKHIFHYESWWDTNTCGPMDNLAYTITDEIKKLHFLCQFETTANAGRTRGMSHILQVMSLLRAIAKIAHALAISLAEAHGSTKFQVALRSSISSVGQGFASQPALMALLKDAAFWQGVGTIRCEVPRLVPEADLSDVLTLLKKKRNVSVDQSEQNPLIPTRLFGKIISGALNQLKAAEPYLPRLEAYVKAVQSDPRLCVEGSSHYSMNVLRIRELYPDQTFPAQGKQQCLSTLETMDRFELATYAKQVGLKSLNSIDGHITHLQVLCILLIHAFSGMRRSEVQVMPFEPIVHSAAKSFGDLPILVSHLQKFSKSGNYSRPVVWATSQEGLYAVRIAQQLTQIRWFRKHAKEDSLPSNIPLFMGSFVNRTARHAHYSFPIAFTPFGTDCWKAACQSLGLIIEAEDLEELRVFDAFRAWDENPNFAVGELWPLASHQFRRSVAVYSSRSKMVSLPTLKTQFKHLTEVMTALYSENSTFAENFLIDENGKPIDSNSVLTSFRDAVAFNTSVRFHEQVIQSEQRLKGAIGADIQRAKDKNNLPKIFQSREETEKAVKQGRFSFRETPVGGCVLKSSCTHFAVDLVLPCTNGCKEAILVREKLETYVESLRFDMKVLSPNSRPYQLIAKEIDFVTSNYIQRADVDL